MVSPRPGDGGGGGRGEKRRSLIGLATGLPQTGGIAAVRANNGHGADFVWVRSLGQVKHYFSHLYHFTYLLG